MTLRMLSLVLLSTALLAGCQALSWTGLGRTSRPVLPDPAAHLDLSALGKTADGSPLELDLGIGHAVSIALANHPGLRLALEEPKKAGGDLLSAWAGVLPSATVNLNYNRLDEVQKFTMEAPPAPPVDVKIGVRDNYRAELGLRQPLFQGFRGLNRLRLAGMARDHARLSVDRTARRIASAVRRAYIDVLFARESVVVLEKSLLNARAHLKSVQDRLGQKLAARFDRLRAEVSVANARAALHEGRSNLDASRALFLRLLGLPQDTRARLTDRLVFRPGPLSLARSMESAFKNRLDLRMREMEEAMQDKKVDLAYGGLLPQAYGYFNWGWEKPSQKSLGGLEGEDYWNAGLAVEIPLFDGFAALGGIRKETAALRQARWAREELRQQVALEVRTAVSALGNAIASVKSQDTNVRQAEESLRLAELGFEEGVRTQLDVLDAQTALTAARLNHLRAVYRFTASRFALEEAEGRVKAEVKER
jgi:outer membrane protein TolC